MAHIGWQYLGEKEKEIMEISIEGPACVNGSITLPGDKSISHRALIFSSLSNGKTKVENILLSDDCLSTVSVLRKLGVRVSINHRMKSATVWGKGKRGFSKPSSRLFCGNSGTTMRLMAGILAGQGFTSVLYGDESLNDRPMRRVVEPLSLMGANLEAVKKRVKGRTGLFPPLTVKPGNLVGTRIKLNIASAQVKSAVLLAGLYAKGITCVKEPFQSRDHTERLLEAFGVKLLRKSNWLCISGLDELKAPGWLYVPGDISSAAFFIALALLSPNSVLRLNKVGINPSRAGFLNAVQKMGGDISFKNKRKSGEPYADIVVKSSRLRGIKVKAKEIPLLIDEIPILAVCAAFARGKTRIENVGELRVKESDRVKAIQYNLRKIGAQVDVLKKDGREDIVITPAKQPKPAKFRSFNDHRIAMAMAIAGLLIDGRSAIDDGSCVGISFPEFWTLLKRVVK